MAEFGFISNSTEEKFIGSEKGRDTYARCLFNAFSEYKTRCEGHGTLIVLDDDKPEGNSVSEGNDPQESQKELSAPSRSDSRPIYRIQVASADRKLPKNAAQFKEYRGKVTEMRIGNMYKIPKQMARLRTSLTRARNELALAEENVALDVRAAYVHYLDSFELLKTQEKSLQLARENYGHEYVLFDCEIRSKIEKLENETDFSATQNGKFPLA